MMYGIKTTTPLYVQALGLKFNVRYTVEQAEPDVGIGQDYIDFLEITCDAPEVDCDDDDVRDYVISELYSYLGM